MLLRCVKGKAPLIASKYRSTVVPTSDSSNCDRSSECAHKHVQVHVHTRRNIGGALLRMVASFGVLSARARATLARAGGACVETARCVAVQLPAVWQSVLHTAATGAASHTAHR